MNEWAEALALVNRLEERVELEKITLTVLADELDRIALQMKDIERQVREL